ncbi:murein hydrolase activator EnvC family protein [Candidatus Thiosymbion oneisti]|uniref:murein hydrolase activator EnvC family protein n=1 Tax=Candidatus Thiosymbion oneisti TaxID=589554 RepID=UPI000B7ECC9E|nr:peptidoglycan DD-metalloendopeptidase family protein [Candidatus Thiosymbion oneisti]
MSAPGLIRRRLHLVVVLLVSIPTLVPAGTEDEAIEGRKRDLADIEQQVRDLEQNLDVRRGRRQELRAELERRERKIADLARTVHRLMTMIGNQERVLEELQSRLVVEREILGRERTALENLLRSAYAMGPENHIRILLNQEDSNRLSRVMAYYGFLNRFRIQRIEAVTQRARRLDDLVREAAKERGRLVLLVQSRDETRARLMMAQDKRTALLTSLEQTIATRAERIEELRAQAREMHILLERLEQQARALPEAELHQKLQPLKQLRGHLAWPLADASLLSHYGSRKAGGIQRWDGVVLRAEEGAKVRAVYHGQVAYADWLRGFGLLLIIAHDDDYMTLYGHNQALLKERGEWVAAGETIALSGSSGGRLSPGLYFAIRYRGRPLNPEQWCRPDVGSGRESAADTSAAKRVETSLLPPST